MDRFGFAEFFARNNFTTNDAAESAADEEIEDALGFLNQDEEALALAPSQQQQQKIDDFPVFEEASAPQDTNTTSNAAFAPSPSASPSPSPAAPVLPRAPKTADRLRALHRGEEDPMIAYDKHKAAVAAASASASASAQPPRSPTPPPPPKKKGPKGPRLELRKPDFLSQEKWDSLSKEGQNLNSHAGRMIETDAGQERAEGACARCVRLRAPWFCKEYTPQAKERYDGRAGTNKCAHCRLAKTKCE